jgi:ABC-type uncharacterized transport system ATPase subunit
VLGPDWHNYFNFIVTDANKPDFFSVDEPFSAVDTANMTLLSGSDITTPSGARGAILSKGSWRKLMADTKR